MSVVKKRNKGRNVINIQALKDELKTFAEQKKMPEEIAPWLDKVFLRWLINSFPYVQVVQSKERYRALIKENAPKWFTPEKNDSEYIYLDLTHGKFQESLNNASEYLFSQYPKRAHKFHKMTVEQVLKKWQEDHERMKKRQKKYKETTGEALEFVFKLGDITVVKLKPNHPELSLEMAKESALMQHCLGEFENVEKAEGGYGEYYFNKINKKELSLYSLRDNKNRPHATVSVYSADEELWLEQIKGKQNKYPVDKYIPASIELFNRLDIRHDYHDDCLGMGIFFIEGKTQHISTIKDEKYIRFLIAYKADLILKMQEPSAALQWLASLRKPILLEKMPQASDAMKITGALQRPVLMTKISLSMPTKLKSILKSVEKYRLGTRTFRFVKLRMSRF